MNLFKKIFISLSLIVIISTFLYSKKQENQSNNCSSKVKNLNQSCSNEKNRHLASNTSHEENICDPCNIKNLQIYNQGFAICEQDLPKAYIAPGRIEICRKHDVFITASYLFWEALGDQLDLGIVRFGTLNPQEYEIIKLNTKYDSGFKVGLGTNLNLDHWSLYARYTRFHSSISTTFVPSLSTSTQDTFQTPYFMAGFNDFFFMHFNGGVKATWSIHLDKIDLELARSFYIGTHLIFQPFIGVSTHWFDQKYNFNLTYQNIPFFGDFKTDSWAIGSRVGLGSKWIFYKGFRIFGYGAYDLLYCSNETSGSGSENEGSGINTVDIINYKLNKDKQNILRDVQELSIGLGWGSYFKKNTWHFDLAISYERQKYSHTNYMSRYAQEKISNSKARITTIQVKPGDTFLHGLTVAWRLDF